jgi:hypothetical protein
MYVKRVGILTGACIMYMYNNDRDMKTNYYVAKCLEMV